MDRSSATFPSTGLISRSVIYLKYKDLPGGPVDVELAVSGIVWIDTLPS